MPNRSFDEHMVIELKDGRLMMLVRTYSGIGVSYSSDRGHTWSQGTDSGLGGPSSRFHIRRLRSGRILLINHVDFTGRNNLTALLSEDEGKTWCAKLLLDARDKVSYPDVAEGDDGYLYITYDRERGGFRKSLSEALGYAREILLSRITEHDILQGKLVDGGSFLGHIVSKLGAYTGENKNPYGDPHLYSDREYAAHLMKKYEGEERINRIFDCYVPQCDSLHKCALDRVDQRIAVFTAGGCDDDGLLTEIVSAIREMAGTPEPVHPTVERITRWVDEHLTEELSLGEMAEHFCMSRYYLCHFFKQQTGITVLEYRNEKRLTRAKQLLVSSERKVVDIAADCITIKKEGRTYIVSAALFFNSKGRRYSACVCACGQRRRCPQPHSRQRSDRP
ncbi:MAG: exo-alpha-sialidase [Clostridia bacterium]|nr:exo-alpha-sialidase [Clostridia bacterium]